MAQTARYRSRGYSYAYDGNAARAARPERPQRSSRPDVRVIPGRRGENPAFAAISPEFARAFKLAIVAVMLIAVICGIRVWLSVTTVSALESANSLESTLESALASTRELEIQHSILASSTRIEEEATKIGMIAPQNINYIKVIMPSTVVTNIDGSISLSGTIQNVEDYVASAAR